MSKRWRRRRRPLADLREQVLAGLRSAGPARAAEVIERAEALLACEAGLLDRLAAELRGQHTPSRQAVGLECGVPPAQAARIERRVVSRLLRILEPPAPRTRDTTRDRTGAGSAMSPVVSLVPDPDPE